MFAWLKEKWQEFVDNHLVSDFPDIYPDFCFDCNKGGKACKTCRPYHVWKEDVDKGMECWMFERGIE